MAILPNLAPLKVYWHAPAPIFVARVNLTSPVYPIQDIPFDGVTVGAYTDLGADMFFTLGDATNADIYGRGRLRAAPTATVLKVGRSSEGTDDGQLSVVDNAYIRVYPDYRVHAKIPVIKNYIEYKDTDVPVGDLTEEPPPIANMGPDRARSIDADSGLARFYFDSSDSFAVADGATIVSVAWDIGDGDYVLGTGATDSDIFADFGAGVRYVSLTVTDSNSKTHTTRRLVLADDPDDSLCVSGMQVQSIARGQQGFNARLRVLQELPRADYPDGGHVLIWEDRNPAIYGDPDPADLSNLFFTGWHQTDQASSRSLETHLQRETTLVCVDVLGRQDSLPGFPQRVEVPTAADLAADGMNWGYMPAANMDRFTCYLVHWHSTADGVADFRPSGTWDEYPFVLFDSGGDSLYNQLQRQASRIVPDHNFTSDQFGRMAVVVNPQFQPLADRAAATNNITSQSWSEISFDYQRPPRVHTTRGSALLVQTEWVIDDDDEKQLLTPVFSIAPGTAPGQGAREVTLGERLTKSQEALNDCVGQHHAYDNARYGNITVTLNANSSPWSFDPASFTYVEFTVPAEAAPQRGIDFVTTRALVKDVTAEYTYSEEGTSLRGRVTLEVETVGLPALTEVEEDALPVGVQPIATVPPDSGLVGGQELVVAIGIDGYRYKTTDFQTPSGSGGPTWARDNLGIAATIYSWVVDPFSPGYEPGATSGAVNGWIVNDTDIYRVTDVHGTAIATSVFTFPVATNGAAFHWRTIQASFGGYFLAGVNPWLVCVSYYGDTAGHTGTWATRSVDGGLTWSAEVQVSADYAAATPTRYNPIGLFTSPRAPGRALTAAHTPVTEDPLEPLPHWGIWNDDTNTLLETRVGGTITYDIEAIAGVGDGLVTSGSRHVLVAMPADAKRAVLECSYSSVEFGVDPGFGAFAHSRTFNVTTFGGLHFTMTNDLIFTPNTSGTFTVQWTRTLGDTEWYMNRDDLPAITNENHVARFRMEVNSSVSGDCTASNFMTLTATVTEIELENGTIYTPLPSLVGGSGFISGDWGATWAASPLVQPGNAMAGTIHVPWIDNDDEALALYGKLENGVTRAFRLKSANGASVSDISPTVSAILYGVNRGAFGVRAFDSDRQHLLLAGIGNETSLDPADDFHAIFYSANYGASWSNIVAPIADSSAPAGRPAFEAAFGADDSDVIFIWGPPDYISYSDDAGATVDDRSGNLSSFGVPGLIGIAGGPTP